MSAYIFELLGILIALGLLIFLAFRGYTLLLAAPAAAIVAAAFSGEPLLAKWTLTFMQGTGRFVTNFFPLFLLGGVFGKLMDDSGAALSVARSMTERLGEKRAVMAVVLACALLTYGGVSLFVVAFAVFPVAAALFRQAGVPHRLIPPAIALGAFTFTMTALPGTPAIQNAIPMAYFGTTLFAAPVLGVIASAIILGFGLWWLRLIETHARRAGESYSTETPATADDQFVRERAANADNFDPAELPHGHRSTELPSFALSVAPILIVLVVNLLMSLFVLPRVYTGFLAERRFGETSLSAVSGAWSVVTALAIASLITGRDPSQAPTGVAQDPRRRRQRLCAAGAQYGQLGGLRRRRRGVAGVRRGPRRIPGGTRRAARVDCRCRQRDGWHHGLGIRRIGHRVKLAGRYLCPTGHEHGHSP